MLDPTWQLLLLYLLLEGHINGPRNQQHQQQLCQLP